MFATEQEMSKRFEKYLKTNFGNTYLKEHPGLFGVPDFVYYAKQDEEISFVTFELKLKNWKRAAKQAFRFKSFSNISYVVIGSSSANAALNNIDLFKKYNIGLASFDNKDYFKIHFKPELNKPYSENLNQKLVDTVANSRKRAKNFEILFG
jgi:hypothetical protein